MTDDEATHREPKLTPHRPMRVDAELWDSFGQLVGDRNRSEIVRRFIAWYVRRPGAKLPQRPQP